MKYSVIFFILIIVSCAKPKPSLISDWVPYDETKELAENANHTSSRMRYKLIQSRVSDKNDMLKYVSNQLGSFTETDYLKLKPFILEQDILTLQSYVKSGKLTYEKLTQWYLYRIVKYETNPASYLNNLISINPNAVSEARKKDQSKTKYDHLIFGMPIIIKDNINLDGMITTAGAVAFQHNMTGDAFIVKMIKEKGGIILAKSNLSEWANYLCLTCPNGYSAMGGQTLNPYGRRQFDTGGSSSGSGSSMAVNYAAAAIGTETSGSILSPSNASSLVGLKPTVGLLSRGGIVPISSTLDTPGPMTRSVADNAILLSAMSGEDPDDEATIGNPKNVNYWEDLKTGSLTGLRFGVDKSFLTDSLYLLSIEKIKSQGGLVFEFEPEKIDFEGFGTILNVDMKIDLPSYIEKYGSKSLTFKSVADIVAFNTLDTLLRIPYGQGRFEGIISESISEADFIILKKRIKENAIKFFETPIQEFQLDAVLSISNRNAGFAAAAQYPCLIIPMGYELSGQPVGLTFIGRPYSEDKLLKMGYAFEQISKVRKIPDTYK
jgi:amidase